MNENPSEKNRNEPWGDERRPPRGGAACQQLRATLLRPLHARVALPGQTVSTSPSLGTCLSSPVLTDREARGQRCPHTKGGCKPMRSGFLSSEVGERLFQAWPSQHLSEPPSPRRAEPSPVWTAHWPDSHRAGGCSGSRTWGPQLLHVSGWSAHTWDPRSVSSHARGRGTCDLQSDSTSWDPPRMYTVYFPKCERTISYIYGLSHPALHSKNEL